MAVPLMMQGIESVEVAEGMIGHYPNRTGSLSIALAAGPPIGFYGNLAVYSWPENAVEYPETYDQPRQMAGSINFARIRTAEVLSVGVTYDGGKHIKIYFPPLATSSSAISFFYIADDGSTYYDSDLTQLAQAAPPPGMGTIQINVNLANAPWNITGPQNYTGNGPQIISNVMVGNYTITYLEVTGYTTPATETFTLAEGQTITFTGNYSEIPVGEGFGAVVSFTADKTTASPEEIISVPFTLRNDGAVADDLIATVYDMFTENIVLPTITFPAVPVGGTVDHSFQITMPSRNLTLQLAAGHVE